MSPGDRVSKLRAEALHIASAGGDAYALPPEWQGRMDAWAAKMEALARALYGDGKMNAHQRLVDAIGQILSDNGCDCDCEHHPEEHDEDCERCLACRVEAALNALPPKPHPALVALLEEAHAAVTDCIGDDFARALVEGLAGRTFFLIGKKQNRVRDIGLAARKAILGRCHD